MNLFVFVLARNIKYASCGIFDIIKLTQGFHLSCNCYQRAVFKICFNILYHDLSTQRKSKGSLLKPLQACPMSWLGRSQFKPLSHKFLFSSNVLCPSCLCAYCKINSAEEINRDKWH